MEKFTDCYFEWTCSNAFRIISKETHNQQFNRFFIYFRYNINCNHYGNYKKRGRKKEKIYDKTQKGKIMETILFILGITAVLGSVIYLAFNDLKSAV